AAIVLQALALALVAQTPSAPYLAWKMAYLAVYPLAVGGAYVLAVAVRSAEASRLRSLAVHPSSAGAWIAAIVLLVLAVRSIAATPKPTPVITDSLLAAGRWAREHVP